jgi:hypothetical protein
MIHSPTVTQDAAKLQGLPADMEKQQNAVANSVTPDNGFGR